MCQRIGHMTRLELWKVPPVFIEDGEIALQSTVRSIIAYSSSLELVADELTTISHVSTVGAKNEAWMASLQGMRLSPSIRHEIEAACPF
jgi:hypothetical protein